MIGLAEAVSNHTSLRERVESLCQRLHHQRFQLAVLGQFKRGKSTFINALLGAPLLPIAVVPLTAVPVFITWRPHALIQVRFADGRPNQELSADDPDVIRQFLFRFISEEANPQNELRVERVDLSYPSSILAGNLILIDTPGVGSTFRHNTKAAVRVLSECDAVVFVVSVDPPITEVEIDYLRQIKSKAAKLLFVLNKIDYLRTEERDYVAAFVERTLEQHDLWPADTMLFRVSAADGLDAKGAGDEIKLKASGIVEVERYISIDLAAQKDRLLEEAVLSKAANIAAEAVSEVRLQIRALEMPLEQLADKCRTFQQTLVLIAGQRRIICDLLQGERRRVREQLEQRIEALRQSAMAKLVEIVNRQLRQDENLDELSQTIADTFDAARQELTSSFVAAVDSALAGHLRRIGSLVEDVRMTASALFNTPFPGGFEPDPLSLGEDPYWITEKMQTSLLPDASSLVDLIVPPQARLRRRRARTLRQLDELILRNAENLRWAILRGIDETFRMASYSFEEHLDDAIAATDGVVREALEQRRINSLAVVDELARLETRKDLLCGLRKQFRSAQPDQARQPEEEK